MKAILQHAIGAAETLYLGECPSPEIKAQEVLVRVKATALNRADLLQRRGLYPPPPGASEILGLEMSGEIVSIGSDVVDHKVGDRVFALLSGGGYAEYVSVPQDHLVPLPATLTWEEGAGIAEAFLTAWQAVRWLAELQKGEKILIHAGASGVGTAALQIAKSKGATVFVTASKGKHDFCKNLGADYCIDYRTEDFSEVVKAKNPQGVDVVIDFIGAPYFLQNIAALAMDGRMVHLGFMGGTKLEGGFNLMPLLLKRLKIMGSTLRARTLAYKAQLTKDFWTNNSAAFTSGTIHPVIDRVFDWKEVVQAHQYMEANKNKGKIILKVNP